MARPKRTEAPKLLTEVERELMACLWEVGEGTIRDIMSVLPAARTLAYTSVATIFRILEGKGMVKRDKTVHPHHYVPVLTKVEYEGRSVTDLVDKVFGGAPAALVARLIDEKGLSREDVKELQRLLEENGQ